MKSLVLAALTFLIAFNASADGAKKTERKPAAGVSDVEVNKLTNSPAGQDLLQIIDKTNRVVCYARLATNSSAMSCVPVPVQ